MSLTIFPSPLYLPGIRPTMAATPSRSAKAPVTGPQIIRFSGKALKNAGKNGLWVTVERVPCKVGGLGEVSKTIPEAIAKYTDKDIRVMVPYLAPMIAEDYLETGKQVRRIGPDGQPVQVPERRPKKDAFQPTGVKTLLKGPDGRTEVFELLQKFEPLPGQEGKPGRKRGVWVYAVKNNKYFSPFNDLYLWHLKPEDPRLNGIGQDAMFKAIMMFNRAAAALIPRLDESAPDEPGTRLQKFDGDAGFIIAHDWHSGPLLNELPGDYQVGKLFMLHNTYDEPRSQDAVDALDLRVPEFLTAYSSQEDGPLRGPNPYTGQIRNVLAQDWSPLSIGIQAADAVIANANYVRSITGTRLSQGAQFVPHLKTKVGQDRVIDMHHGLSEEYNPYGNPALRNNRFSELQRRDTVEAQLKEMRRFKRSNQRALQRMIRERQAAEGVPEALRFREDDKTNYVVMNWVARFEPYQKGFFLLMNEARDFLRSHPNAQLVMGGRSDGSPRIEQWIDRINAEVAADPELRGRLYLPNQFVDRQTVVQINAGSDFTILPSLYEPYGLTQLESMTLGSIPIVHGVDGLRSTVSDPALNGKDFIQTPGQPEKVWDYGQTGVLMEPIDVAAYRSAIMHQDGLFKEFSTAGEAPADIETRLVESLSPDERAVLADAQGKFRSALERALTLGRDEKRAMQVRLDGMRFVENEHRWDTITERYERAIEQVTRDLPGTRLKTTA